MVQIFVYSKFRPLKYWLSYYDDNSYYLYSMPSITFWIVNLLISKFGLITNSLLNIMFSQYLKATSFSSNLN